MSGVLGIDPLPGIRLDPCFCGGRLRMGSLAAERRWIELERHRLGAKGQDAVKNLRISMMGESRVVFSLFQARWTGCCHRRDAPATFQDVSKEMN